jgi:hypothetical protein
LYLKLSNLSKSPLYASLILSYHASLYISASVLGELKVLMNISKFNPLSSSIIKRNPTAIPLNLFNSAPSRVVVWDRYGCLPFRPPPPSREGEGWVGGGGRVGGGLTIFITFIPGGKRECARGVLLLHLTETNFLTGVPYIQYSDRGVLRRGC